MLILILNCHNHLRHVFIIIIIISRGVEQDFWHGRCVPGLSCVCVLWYLLPPRVVLFYGWLLPNCYLLEQLHPLSSSCTCDQTVKVAYIFCPFPRYFFFGPFAERPDWSFLPRPVLMVTGIYFPPGLKQQFREVSHSPTLRHLEPKVRMNGVVPLLT